MDESVSAAGIDAVAALLLDARSRGIQIPAPSVSTFAAACAIARNIARVLGDLKTWKAAAFPNDDILYFAPIPSAAVRATGAQFAAGAFNMIGLESELTISLNRPFRARDPAPTRDEVVGAIEAIAPAIEIVDTRLLDWANTPRLSRLADNMSSGALVVGDAFANWRDLDLFAPGFALSYGNTLIGPPGKSRLGDPIAVAEHWLAHCRSERIDLEPGAMITTGTNTGIAFVEAGQQITLASPTKTLVTAQL